MDEVDKVSLQQFAHPFIGARMRLMMQIVWHAFLAVL